MWMIAALNSLTIILLAVKLNQILTSWFTSMQLLAIAILYANLGLSCFIFIHQFIGVMLGVLLLSLAEAIFIPALAVLFASSAPAAKRVAMLAINALLAAMGESLGYYYGIISGLSDTRITLINVGTIYSIALIGIYSALKHQNPHEQT